LFFRCEIIVSGILPRGRDLYRVENGVAIQAPLLNLLNRKAGYINERLRYIASSLPRLTYTPHPRFVVDSVIQRSLLCKDGLHFSSRGSVQVVVDLEKAISTVRASLHAAQKRPVVSRPATPRPVVTPSEDTKTVSFSYRDALLTTFQILQPVSVPLFTIDNFPALSPVSYASNILSLFTARPTVVSVTGNTRPTVVSVTGLPRSAAVWECKILSHRIATSRHWFSIKKSIMTNLLLLKFQQVPPFKQFLLETTNRPLLHNVGNSWWGTGLNGTGLNTQGVLLMQLRNSHLSSVSGPDSPPVTASVPDSPPVSFSS